MKAPKIKLKSLGIYLFSAFLYPAFAYLKSERSPLLDFINALTITGLVFLIIGIVFSMILKGDFDISEYLIRRSFEKDSIKPFKAFREDKQETRRTRINEPFLTGVIALVISALLAAFFY